MPERPGVVGKRDEHGDDLIPGYGALDADALRPGVAGATQRVWPTDSPRSRPLRTALTVTSRGAHAVLLLGLPAQPSTTAVPDGALVGAGIGCHTMALLMDPDRVGNIAGITCMGNEGTQWIGMAPFVDRDHFIQNLGDGTYFHSGQLAVTAAVAAGVNITYKLLYNGAVAMTGGQHPEGQRSGRVRSRPMLLAQGVSEVLITTDDTRAYRKVSLPHAASRCGRASGSLEAQEHLADGPGRDRADPRPGVRGRAAPGAQARSRADADPARRDQPPGLRGLRRLRRDEQLPVGAAVRHRRSGARPASTRPRATSTSRVSTATVPRSSPSTPGVAALAPVTTEPGPQRELRG